MIEGSSMSNSWTKLATTAVFVGVFTTLGRVQAPTVQQVPFLLGVMGYVLAIALGLARLTIGREFGTWTISSRGWP